MSNRRSGLKNVSSNPTTKFIEWKSNDKKFAYYDKSKGDNVFIDLPFKFLFLEDLSTVKGWHNDSDSGIYANEVLYISSQEMTVKAFKGGEIATGLYKDIKAKVNSAGGKYIKSVYIMLEDGSLANIQMKGSVVRAFSEFQKKNKSRFPDEWIEVSYFTEGKKGSIKYTVPEFKFEKQLSESEIVQANEVFSILEDYLKIYLKSDEIQIEEEKQEVYEDEIDEF